MDSGIDAPWFLHEYGYETPANRQVKSREGLELLQISLSRLRDLVHLRQIQGSDSRFRL
jgi:hypothetical protein